MPELWSPLDTVRGPGVHGAAPQASITQAPITLGERRLTGLWQLAGWSDFDSASAEALGAHGLPCPQDFCSVATSEGLTAWRVAPDRIWVETPRALPTTEALVALDLSQSRTVITLKGTQARALLALLCSVEVSAQALPAGGFVQTGIAHTAVLLQCLDDESFEILVPVTWAASLWEAICHNATPFGYTVEGLSP